MSDQNVQEATLTVDAVTAFGLRTQEFDKVIAEAEARVADLKRQKATFIYETNFKAVMERAQQSQAPVVVDQGAQAAPAKE